MKILYIKNERGELLAINQFNNLTDIAVKLEDLYDVHPNYSNYIDDKAILKDLSKIIGRIESTRSISIYVIDPSELTTGLITTRDKKVIENWLTTKL